jgi:protein-S-isoprenylcysteine O-methyltransferase Ste14
VAVTNFTEPAIPSPPFRAEREGPATEPWEDEVGVGERPGIPHLTPTLSAPRGGEGARDGSSWSPAARLAALQRSRAYDIAMRLPLLLWCAFLGMSAANDLMAYLGAAAGAPPALYAVNIAMRLSLIGFFVVLVASVATRGTPIDKAQGIEPRLSALLGTLLITAIVFLPRHELSPALGAVSTGLILCGNAFAIAVLLRLGRSFSVMAEARQLVTAGVYRHVRHPLYLAEEIAAVGCAMQFFSLWAVLLLAAQIAFQLRRMANEERVLAENFPEYARYRQNTARLIPGLY